jgi:hypothetical protein
MCETWVEAQIGSLEADALRYSKLLKRIYVQQRRKLRLVECDICFEYDKSSIMCLLP